MRLNGGTVDQNLRRRPTSLSQCAKQIDPHALRGPAHVSIIECLPRAIFRGASTQQAPDFRTCTMPLITRRSSTRALRRVSVGRCGLIFENCGFVSQNWSRLILCLLFGSRESRHYARANTFMGPYPSARAIRPEIRQEEPSRHSPKKKKPITVASIVHDIMLAP